MVARADRRRAKLKALLGRLQAGENVQNRDLRTWLGAEAYAEFEQECATQTELREELKDKPGAVKEYEERLRLALLAYNKGEGASARGKQKAAKTYFGEADRLFERALERLNEEVAADPSLCVWFDRDIEWTPENAPALSPVSVPRVVTSRSLDNKGGGLAGQLQSKRELKIAAIERALLEQDGAETGEGSNKDRQRLASFWKQHDDEQI